MVDVVENMVMFPVHQWVKSAGSVTQKNHFEKMCRTKKKVNNRSHKQLVNTVNDSDSSDTEYFVETINQKDISAVNTSSYNTIDVEEVKVNFQLD